MPSSENNAGEVLFEQIHHELESLEGLLGQEKTALEDRDMDSLAKLVRNKTELCSSLEKLEKQRQQQPTNMMSDAQTHTLLELFSDINEMNRLNGMIVTSQLQRSKTALSILSGRHASDNQTYSENGISSSPGQTGWVVST